MFFSNQICPNWGREDIKKMSLKQRKSLKNKCSANLHGLLQLAIMKREFESRSSDLGSQGFYFYHNIIFFSKQLEYYFSTWQQVEISIWFSNWVEFSTSHRIYFKYKHWDNYVKNICSFWKQVKKILYIWKSRVEVRKE